MKVELDELRLGISPLTENAFIGVVDKKRPLLWKCKKEIHNDFIHAVITCWRGTKQVVTGPEGNTFEISVKEIKETIKI